jgi:LmbE family N-acetylglucosaminyl deacetylase
MRRMRASHSFTLGIFALSLATVTPAGFQSPPADHGAAGAWQKLLKLRTTASVLHTTAHPDDEHGGVLTMLSRGAGAQVSLLTLTRGESGDNALGPELFDALGLIRTEELLLADRYYGVDRQYFGTVVDYGFSKRLDETIEKWGIDYVLRDIVGVIRAERPLVVIARFQGNERDGHGNHSAAGMVTRDAFAKAGDPSIFPDQLAKGLRPWRPLKLYMGGVRANEDWTIRVDAGRYDPVLGDSYQSIARRGLSFQRSQNGGRSASAPGPAVSYYKRLQSTVHAAAKEQSFFDGIDSTLPGIYRTLGKTAPAGTVETLTAVAGEIDAAVRAFSFTKPSASAPALARALGLLRRAIAGTRDEDVAFTLRAKERQAIEALDAVLGIALTAVAQPTGTPEPTGPFNPGPAAMPPVVPGQRFDVNVTFVNRSGVDVRDVRISLDSAERWVSTPASAAAAAAAENEPVARTFTVTVPQTARVSRPYFSRNSIQATRYDVADDAARHQPYADPPLFVVAQYVVEGVQIESRRPVTRLEANLPYGYDTRTLAVVPTLAVTLTPGHAVVPIGGSRTVIFQAEVINNQEGKVDGDLRLNLPQGWTATPAAHELHFTRAGERAHFRFAVAAPSATAKPYDISAVARVAGQEFSEGYSIARYRDLEPRYLYRKAAATVTGVEVKVPAGVKVGYVMGIGDDVPAALTQLGADVQLLGERELAGAQLSQFNAIITGTRAYAVRQDLITYNRRLLDYVREGGNLIVLYNTFELDPKLYAPYPGELTRNAEEVSEEASPLEILAADAPVLNAPNRITKADFDNWVEQRGSKFWSSWDARYTPIIATWDRGQAPQKGGWLHARYGKGHYTYFAYALHRQLPYGVPGAYRIVANLLAQAVPGR